MALICPNCRKINKCNCINCNPNKDVIGIILTDDKLYKCFYCHHNFHEQDSLDIEWDEMIDRFIKDITPEMCIDYFENESTRVEIQKTYGNFGFQRALYHHFKVSGANKETIKYMKRELKLRNLLNE